jgi:hypothetical protein
VWTEDYVSCSDSTGIQPICCFYVALCGENDTKVKFDAPQHLQSSNELYKEKLGKGVMQSDTL